MQKNGWLHIEGSVYMSKKPMGNMSVSHTIDKLKNQYPYLTKCIKRMHQSDISNIHSLENHFDYDGTPGEYAKKKHKVKKQRTVKHKKKSR